MTTLRLALCFWLLVSSGLWADEDRTITVTGEATIEAAPDMATVSVSVTHQAPEAAAALEATSQATGEVIARLSADGVAPEDMQTEGLSLQPVWSDRQSTQNRREITGFVARNGLNIRVRDLGKLGSVLDLVVQDGANGFGGLRFGLQNPAPLESEARKAAVKDAMARATELAEAAGVTLGPVQTISQSGGFARPVQMEMADARMSSAVPIAAGEVGIRAQVMMVFGIAD